MTRSCADKAGDWRSLSSITSSRLSRIAALEASSPRRNCSRRLNRVGWRPERFAHKIVPVRIGDPQPGQDFHFQWFHQLGIARPLMIVARQMQHAMHHQMGGMIADLLSRGLRLAGGDAIRDSDVAAIAVRICRRRKGKNIGRLVLAPKTPIQDAQSLIAGEQYGQRVFAFEAAMGQGRVGSAPKAASQAARRLPFGIVHQESNAPPAHLPLLL